MAYRIDTVPGRLVDVSGKAYIRPAECPAEKFAEEHDLDFKQWATSIGVDFTEPDGAALCLDGTIACSYFRELRAEGAVMSATVLCSFDKDESRFEDRLLELEEE